MNDTEWICASRAVPRETQMLRGADVRPEVSSSEIFQEWNRLMSESMKLRIAVTFGSCLHCAESGQPSPENNSDDGIPFVKHAGREKWT
jgi:hypothetical protein